MNKKNVLKIALHLLLKDGSADINSIAEMTGFNIKKLNEAFPSGDKELLMDTVEFAGKTWVEKLQKEIAAKNSVREKLKTLASGYTLGSQYYPESLSVYIDLWKTIKDNQDEYMKSRLKEIYHFYISAFCNMINEIGSFHIKYEELYSFSLFMTVLSDVLHIQSITLENDVDFKSFEAMIEKLTVLFFMGVPNE